MPHQFRALGRIPKGQGTSRLNKTEQEYARMLGDQVRAGTVLWYRFEAIKIRLADLTFYTPDFLVLPASLQLEIHEVKGAFVMDDARVKLKVAAEIVAMGVVLAQKVKKAWHVEVLA